MVLADDKKADELKDLRGAAERGGEGPRTGGAEGKSENLLDLRSWNLDVWGQRPTLSRTSWNLDVWNFDVWIRQWADVRPDNISSMTGHR